MVLDNACHSLWYVCDNKYIVACMATSFTFDSSGVGHSIKCMYCRVSVRCPTLTAEPVFLSLLFTLCSHVPPSQGGKYVGFGSTPDQSSSSRSAGQFDSGECCA